MISLLALKNLLAGVEFTGMTPGPETTTYEAKVKGLTEPGIRARVVLNSLMDFPPRVPKNIRIDRAEKGLILKEHKVTWDVRTGMKLPRPEPGRPELPGSRVRALLDEIAESVIGE
ncbi:MAG: hypothetical protein QW356_04635 [Candidatus Hadarchaeales archaeon]